MLNEWSDASSTRANWVGQVLDIGTETSFDCSEFLFCSTAKEYSNLMPNGLLSIDSLPSKTDWLMVSQLKTASKTPVPFVVIIFIIFIITMITIIFVIIIIIPIAINISTIQRIQLDLKDQILF